MSKLLIELGLEESMNDWLDEIQWKRNHDCVAFENAIEECRALARQEVEAERTRCAQACDKLIEEYRQLLRAANECNHRDRVFEYTASIYALDMCCHELSDWKGLAHPRSVVPE